MCHIVETDKFIMAVLQNVNKGISLNDLCQLKRNVEYRRDILIQLSGYQIEDFIEKFNPYFFEYDYDNNFFKKEITGRDNFSKNKYVPPTVYKAIKEEIVLISTL